MPTWPQLWVVAAYSAFFVTLYAIYRIWISHGWAVGLRQLLTFVLFAVLFWLLESWAFYRAPYYYYPPLFPDMIPHYRWDLVSWFPGVIASECDVRLPTLDFGVSRTIILVEASLTFVVMWTTRLLEAPRYLRPFLAGLVFLAVDAFLDPVLARSYDCTSEGGAPGVLPNGEGLEFWRWDVTERLGAWWFGIPLYNYASWYAAPVVLIALASILGWVRQFIEWVMNPTAATAPAMPSLVELVFLLIVLFGFLLIFALAPTSILPIELQALLLVAVVVGSAIAVLWFVGKFNFANAWRWELIYPQLVCVVFPLAAFLLSGLYASVPYLWIVPLVSIPAVVLFAISPYLKAP
jgi:hypothetical protein